MLHKIRKAMSQREERYQPARLVELDKSFFGATKQVAVAGAVPARPKF